MSQNPSGYQILQRLDTWTESFFIDLVEDTAGKQFEMLTVQVPKELQPLLLRTHRNEILPLLKKEIQGVKLPFEATLIEELGAMQIIYSYSAGYGELKEQAVPVSAFAHLASGLSELKKLNVDGFYISPKSLLANGKELQLSFIGLFELMQKIGLVEVGHLSPEVASGERARFQDDIWAIGKMLQSIGAGDEIISPIIEKATKTKRQDRYVSWLDFKNELTAIETKDLAKGVGAEKQGLRVQLKHIQIMVKPGCEDSFKPMLLEMNKSCYYQPQAELSHKKNQIMGHIYTECFTGPVFVDSANNRLFLAWDQVRSRDREIPKDAIELDCTIGLLQNSTLNLYSFFEQARQHALANALTKGAKEKADSLEKWKTLPEKEMEFIEEQALKLSYIDRNHSASNPENVVFTLDIEGRKYPWDKIKQLKSNKVAISVNESVVGLIHDYNPKDGFITIRDCKLEIEEIPERGELVQDVRQEVSQFKKQVEACTKFAKSDILNPDLASMLATPHMIAQPSRLSIDCDEFKTHIRNSRLKTDETQLEAVIEALHRKPLFLIQGPPGTGKTTVIVEMIEQIVRQQPNAKILVTSQSNLAVDNVLERLPEGILFMRLASSEGKVGEKLKAHSYETKIDTWINNTRKASGDFLERRVGTSSDKNKTLHRLFHLFCQVEIKKEALQLFQKELQLPIVPAYFRDKLFGSIRSASDIRQVFEKEIGAINIKLLAMNKEWQVFLDNALGEESNSKVSKIRDGSQWIGLQFAYLKSMNVIGATCIHIASMKYSRVDFKFDYVIMDESSKASPAEALVPINMGRNIIMIGDHKQLPPVVTREEMVKQKVRDKLEDNGLDVAKEFGESLFEKIIQTFESDPQKAQLYRMLDIQYRMPKQIGNIISKYFYDGKLRNPDPQIVPEFDASKRHGLALKNDASMVFLSTSKDDNPYDNNDKFWRQNRCNLEKIKQILEWLNREYPQNLTRTNDKGERAPFTIGVIAGYRGQVDLLQKEIFLGEYENFITQDEKGNDVSLIHINTVDKFQGAEEDIIIYDVVKSNRGPDTIGFLADYRRINVALSRVKRLLIIVGDSEYLLKRATLPIGSQFPEFKLRQIAEEFDLQGLIIHKLEELNPK